MIYTPEIITYLETHYNKDKSMSEVCEHVGTTPPRLRQQIQRLRKKGHVFATRGAEVGDFRVMQRHDRLETEQKQADGKWKYVSSVAINPKRQQNVKPVQKPVREVVTRHEPPKKQIYNATKNPDEMKQPKNHRELVSEGWRTIPINNRTWAFRPPQQQSV